MPKRIEYAEARSVIVKRFKLPGGCWTVFAWDKAMVAFVLLDEARALRTFESDAVRAGGADGKRFGGGPAPSWIHCPWRALSATDQNRVVCGGPQEVISRAATQRVRTARCGGVAPCLSLSRSIKALR